MRHARLTITEIRIHYLGAVDAAGPELCVPEVGLVEETEFSIQSLGGYGRPHGLSPRMRYNAGMHNIRRLTAVTWREGDGVVALCPDDDVASQGTTVEEARANLVEALQLFLETASPAELADR